MEVGVDKNFIDPRLLGTKMKSGGRSPIVCVRPFQAGTGSTILFVSQGGNPTLPGFHNQSISPLDKILKV